MTPINMTLSHKPCQIFFGIMEIKLCQRTLVFDPIQSTMQQLSFIPSWLISLFFTPQDEPTSLKMAWPQVSWFILSSATKSGPIFLFLHFCSIKKHNAKIKKWKHIFVHANVFIIEFLYQTCLLWV